LNGSSDHNTNKPTEEIFAQAQEANAVCNGVAISSVSAGIRIIPRPVLSLSHF